MPRNNSAARKLARRYAAEHREEDRIPEGRLLHSIFSEEQKNRTRQEWEEEAQRDALQFRHRGVRV